MVFAVLAAAVLHTTWNAVVKGSGDQIRIMARSSLVGGVACALGVVVAAVIGMLVFEEPMGRVRVAASVAVAVGVALLALPAA